MEVSSITQSTADLTRVLQEAHERTEPRFVPAQTFVDDRGWSVPNLLRGVLSPDGQVNYTYQHPGVVRAWHRHKEQTDFWIGVAGHLKVGVYDEATDTRWSLVIGEQRPGVVVIPPPLWHGAATVGRVPSLLVYYVDHAYNPDRPDEERRAHDSVDGFIWDVEHG